MVYCKKIKQLKVTMNNNVVCVNWGIKYGQEYTHRLYNMVKRNTSLPFNFFCLTDDTSKYADPIIPIKLREGYEGWWNKMQLFRNDILPTGEYLYLDLDVVIVDNIDCFFEHKGFGISRDFINPDFGLLGGKEYNSSVMRFTQDIKLWKFFNNNRHKWGEKQKEIHFFGDQNVISSYLNQQNFSQPFPDEWIWSYKIGTLRGRRPVDHSLFFGATIPNGGKICVFHGTPNPSEVSTQWVFDHWI